MNMSAIVFDYWQQTVPVKPKPKSQPGGGLERGTEEITM